MIEEKTLLTILDGILAKHGRQAHAAPDMMLDELGFGPRDYSELLQRVEHIADRELHVREEDLAHCRTVNELTHILNSVS